MRVLIVGATGNVGRITIDKALEAGHHVTAFARSAEKIALNDERLQKFQGDVMNAASVETAMAEQEAVITVFGAPVNWSTLINVPNLCTVGTKNIIKAMSNYGIKRLVCMTGIGAGDSRGHGRSIFSNFIYPVLLGRIYEDKNRQEKEVMASNLDWIIVRPTEFTNDSSSGDYRIITKLDGKRAETISRADVADFLVKQVDSDRYLHQTPLITQ